jgi:hypothetical protein
VRFRQLRSGCNIERLNLGAGMRPRIVQCMINFVRCTKFDLYQTGSPPFGRLKVSKEDAAATWRGGWRGGETAAELNGCDYSTLS